MPAQKDIRRVQISLPRPVFDALEKACELLGKRKSEVIEESLISHALSEWNKATKQMNEIQQKRERDTIKEKYKGEVDAVLRNKNHLLAAWGDLAALYLEKLDELSVEDE